MKQIGVIIFVLVFIVSVAVFSFTNPSIHAFLFGSGNGTSTPSTASGTTPTVFDSSTFDGSITPPPVLTWDTSTSPSATTTATTTPFITPSTTPPVAPAPKPKPSPLPTPTPRPKPTPAPTPKPSPTPKPPSPPPVPIPPPHATSTRDEFLANLDPNDIPPGLTAAQLSTYFHKVRIGSATPASPDDPTTYDHVALNTEFEGSQSYDITGWIIKTNRKVRVIGDGIRTLDLSVQPSVQDISLYSGQNAHIYSGTNALNKNFRINKCSGYLQDGYHFNPPLDQQCPVPTKQEIYTFTGLCQDYISSLNTCEVPVGSDVIPDDDYTCQSYLLRLNYNGCLLNHRKDSDFLTPDWWVWVGAQYLDPYHDRVQLLDRQGLVVDEYIY